MSDNQTTMRSMLNLLESVDQNKTITQLNEGIGGAVAGGIAGGAAGTALGGPVGGVIGRSLGSALGNDITDEDIEDTYPDPETLADEALDAAARHIQDALGITTGDFAGMYFSGEIGAKITDILADYAMAEMNHMKDSEEESNLEEGSMKRWLEDKATNLEKSEFVANADEYGMKPEEAAKFWIAVNGEDEELDETQDPNLAKAYRLGNEAYKALKNEPERARAAQDKIYAEFPQYAKMWTMGYNDGERFDKQSIKETVSRKTFRQVADLIKQIPDVNKRRELADHHCEIFKQQNPRFSREKFMSYIGL